MIGLPSPSFQSGSPGCQSWTWLAKRCVAFGVFVEPAVDQEVSPGSSVPALMPVRAVAEFQVKLPDVFEPPPFQIAGRILVLRLHQVKVPLHPSNPAGSPAFASRLTATCGPLRKAAWKLQRPVSSGENKTRQTLPERPPFPSPSKKPGTLHFFPIRSLERNLQPVIQRTDSRYCPPHPPPGQERKSRRRPTFCSFRQRNNPSPGADCGSRDLHSRKGPEARPRRPVARNTK